MSQSGDRQLAGRAAFLRFLEGEVKDTVNATRGLIEPNLEPGERIRAELPDGTVIGSVSRGKPAEYARVTDEKALLDWVKANAPTELVTSVNPAFLEMLKASAKKHGRPVWHEGEVVPGIELQEGSASYRPLLDKGSVPLLRKKLAELIAGGLLELPAAEEKAS